MYNSIHNSVPKPERPTTEATDDRSDRRPQRPRIEAAEDQRGGAQELTREAEEQSLGCRAQQMAALTEDGDCRGRGQELAGCRSTEAVELRTWPGTSAAERRSGQVVTRSKRAGRAPVRWSAGGRVPKLPRIEAAESRSIRAPGLASTGKAKRRSPMS